MEEVEEIAPREAIRGQRLARAAAQYASLACYVPSPQPRRLERPPLERRENEVLHARGPVLGPSVVRLLTHAQGR